jgi:hypothetical protein
MKPSLTTATHSATKQQTRMIKLSGLIQLATCQLKTPLIKQVEVALNNCSGLNGQSININAYTQAC